MRSRWLVSVAVVIAVGLTIAARPYLSPGGPQPARVVVDASRLPASAKVFGATTTLQPIRITTAGKLEIKVNIQGPTGRGALPVVYDHGLTLTSDGKPVTAGGGWGNYRDQTNRSEYEAIALG